MIADLADTHLHQSAAGRFNEGMTAGKGFIGLAAMIFGFADSLQMKLQILRVPIPSESTKTGVIAGPFLSSTKNDGGRKKHNFLALNANSQGGGWPVFMQQPKTWKGSKSLRYPSPTRRGCFG
jgi:hypothetical protein